MVKIVWRSAHSYLPPIAEGGVMDACFIGEIEVGRVQRIGNSGSWICWLPRADGPSYSSWRNERSWLAARSALAYRVRATIAAMGLDPAHDAPTLPAILAHPADDPPTAPATQPDLFGETHV